MPTIFAAGTPNGNGYYSGVTVTTAAALLTQLKTSLEAAGQTVTDEIAANNKIIARGVDQGDYCYKIYQTSLVSGTEHKLSLRGDRSAGGAGTDLSPDTIEIPFSDDGDSVLYLAADAGGECITVINGTLDSKGIHGGWLERRRLADKGAWMVGYLDFWLTNCYFATDVNNTAWAEAKRYFYSAAESFTNPIGHYTFLWDTCGAYTGGISSSVSSTSFNYKPFLGAVDPISLEPKLLPYGYAQGATSYNTYPTNHPATQGRGLHLPGFVRFARTGLGYLDAGEQKRDGTQTFISSGNKGTTGQTGYQGFQIAA
jgi:hypothetical protein